MSSSRTPDFGALAPTYDELRPADEPWRELVELLIRGADLATGRVLDIGCGTGRLAAELARRGASVAGVDPSPQMLAVACERARAPHAVSLEHGHAESLPFANDSFDRAVFCLVVHLVDRAAAFAEARRVLVRGGRVAIASFEPEHFERYFLNPFFPSLARVDRARFPTPGALVRELEEAGFGSVRLRSLHQDVTLAREDVIRRIRGRHISTFHMLDEDEYAVGLARAEAELPEQVATTRDFLLAFARRL
jgi:SAM-dependent methyltransferase